jgi:hypothetical protein
VGGVAFPVQLAFRCSWLSGAVGFPVGLASGWGAAGTE